MSPSEVDLALLYRDARERMVTLVAGLDTAQLGTSVPACPGWSVQDVVAHVTAVAEDVVAGRLTRPPSDEETAAQVARFAGADLEDLLGAWSEVASRLEPVIGQFEVWPAVLDVTAHEHDIRGALGTPGARDTTTIRVGTARLIGLLEPPVPMRVVVKDEEFHVGPPEGRELVLRTERYETFRWRLGRRSRAQIARFDWSDDPSAVLDHLCIFGPATIDVTE